MLTYYIPAVRAAGLTRSQAAIGFTLVNIIAGISRPIWGRLADRGGGTRRARTLRETGIVGAAAALVMLPALHAGVVPALATTAVLAFGVFGFNGLVYLLVGELAGAARSGVAVGVASTVVFGVGALVAPVAGLAVEHLATGRCGHCGRRARPAQRSRGAGSSRPRPARRPPRCRVVIAEARSVPPRRLERHRAVACRR